MAKSMVFRKSGGRAASAPLCRQRAAYEVEKVIFILHAKEITKGRSAGSAASRRQSAKLMRKSMNDSAF
jgi:hypothetical protein